MTDLDAMEYNGRTHRGNATDNHDTDAGGDDDGTVPGDDDLWDALNDR